MFEGPEVIPPPPEGGHGHGGHEDDAHARTVTHDDHGHRRCVTRMVTTIMHHNHEPAIMILPLVVLAIGAIFAGWLNFPERQDSLGGFLGTSPSFRLGYEKARRNPEYNEPVAALPMGQFEANEALARATRLSRDASSAMRRRT